RRLASSGGPTQRGWNSTAPGTDSLLPILEQRRREVLQLCRIALISWADMVLAPSVAGLFKWRQFEPEMILLAVGWYLRFSLSYRDVEELLAERGLRRSRHHLEVGPALCPGTGTTFTLETQLNQRQLARGRDLYPGQGQVGVFIPRGGFDWAEV